MNPGGRLLSKFWLLAILATSALAWSSYQAIAREHSALKARVFWSKQANTRALIERLDSTFAAIIAREAVLAFDDFQSYRAFEDTVPQRAIVSGADSLPKSPIFIPTPLLTGGRDLPNPKFTRLHFELAEQLTIPGLPSQAHTELALSRGHLTPELIRASKYQEQALIATFGLDNLRRLANRTDIAKPTRVAGSRNFHPLFFRATEAAPAELLLVRFDKQPGRLPRLQAVWYDWEKVHQTLLRVAMAEFPGPTYTLTPVPTTGAPSIAQPSGSAAASDATGQLANLALDLKLSGLALGPALAWTQLATNLSIAWAIFLAALFAIHFAIIQSAALSERRARFASAVTHELRTPLTSLCMYTEMLAAGLVPADKQAGYFATIKSEAERLAALIDNVLDHAGLESGRQVQHEPLDFPAWTREQAWPAVELELPDHAQVQVDRRGLERILANLIDNARKYGAAPIRLCATSKSGQLEVQLSDGGPGIDSPDSLFKAFTRGSSAVQGDSSAQGLGLGLNLSRDLARAMGGDLRLVSPGPVAPGKASDRDAGPTAFLLTLPLS